ncbi:MAG: T9SS type A sorting domain-containing protein, partial [Sphingobacteriales bacterium]|nr:T9SS type A sorting domain-containing protein [Sphingobacteriales bacterium]
ESIAIYDIFGRIVKNGTNVAQINTQDLPHGIYIVRATLSNHETITQKITK